MATANMRLMPLKKGHLGIVALSEDATTLEASKEEGYDVPDTLMIEADLAAGQASVTWLGEEGFARIYHKGSSDPEQLFPGNLRQGWRRPFIAAFCLKYISIMHHEGMEGVLSVGDRLDLRSVKDLNAPQSKSTYMLTGAKRSAGMSAGATR